MGAPNERRWSEREYAELILRSPGLILEFHDGEVREKPAMPWDHGSVNAELAFMLNARLDEDEFVIRVNEGRVRCGAGRILVPDIVVVPAGWGERYRGRPDVVPIFGEPLPLVAEVWSPPGGGYDVEARVTAYMARGDNEIWRVHPYERTVTVWVRQSDGNYDSMVYRAGIIRPVALSGVAIDLAELFGR